MDFSTLRHLWDAASSEQLIAPITVVVLVLILCACYFVRYFYRSFSLSAKLKRFTKSLQGVKALAPPLRRSELERLFNGTNLGHSWREYAETLHDQFELKDGEQVLVRSRATTGAAHFFSPQSVVDTPLGTEFYKHLPGILTGIGIVGTFFGLMLGLQHFDPSTR